MLINLKQAFSKHKRCVPAFNFYNLESLQAIITAAAKSGEIMIAAFGEKYESHMPVEAAAALGKTLTDSCPSPLVLHLDHAEDLSVIERSLIAGFSSVMYDGSKKPYEENVKNTKEVVALAKKFGASVEAELGTMNPEDGREPLAEDVIQCTDPAQAQDFVQRTGVDALAVSVGNVHGFYHGKPHIHFDRIREIRDAVQIPLVLHGCSGLSDETLYQAISCGIRKVNINTEFSVDAAHRVKAYLQSHDENTRFDQVMKHAQTAMEHWILEKIQVFL